MHALIQIHTHARTHARTHACTHTCIHIYKTVYVCVCIHRCIHTHTQGNLTTRPKTMCVCVCVCIHTSVYPHNHALNVAEECLLMCVYTYVYTHAKGPHNAAEDHIIIHSVTSSYIVSHHQRQDLTTRPKTTCFPSSHDVTAVVRKNCQKKITTNQKKSLYLHVLVCMDITRHRLPRVGPALRRKRPIKEQKRPMKKQKRPIIYNEASPAKSRARVGHRKKYPKKEQPHIRT